MKAATIIFSPNGGISLIESFALVCMFAHTNLITYESLYSSSYLLNENLLYDKLWGPSQREVTLFSALNHAGNAAGVSSQHRGLKQPHRKSNYVPRSSSHGRQSEPQNLSWQARTFTATWIPS